MRKLWRFCRPPYYRDTRKIPCKVLKTRETAQTRIIFNKMPLLKTRVCPVHTRKIFRKIYRL